MSKFLETKRQYRKEIKDYVRRYLLRHPCVDCGEDDPVVLDFDHVRGTKSFGISRATRLGKTLEQVKTEIKKCQIRCSNCHRRRHAKL